MTRARVLQAIEGTGACGDQAAFLRLYTENRVGYFVATEAYRRGQRFAAFVRARDAAKEAHP